MHIFDMDGTLIDSNGIWREVDEAFLAKRGFPYTKEYYQGVAHTIFPLAAEFTKRYCHLEESVEDIMAEWMEMAGDAYATRVQVKPGVREYLDQCRRRGQRMMVLTSSVPAHCRAALGHLGLMPYFEEILFAHDLKIEKKDPEIFRVAARRMGVEPAECVVYDDSVEACRGAKAAGMHTVGVYDQFFHVSWEEMTRVCERIRNVSPTAYFSSCWQKVCRRRHDSIEVTRRRHKREKHPVGDDKKRKLPHCGPVHTLL